jgi:hypothetical protein
VFVCVCGVQHILCCVFVLFVFVLCTLCCQFLWIVHFSLLLLCSLAFIWVDIFFGRSHFGKQAIYYSPSDFRFFLYFRQYFFYYPWWLYTLSNQNEVRIFLRRFFILQPFKNKCMYAKWSYGILDQKWNKDFLDGVIVLIMLSEWKRSFSIIRR